MRKVFMVWVVVAVAALAAGAEVKKGESEMDKLTASLVAEAEKSHSDALVIRRGGSVCGEWNFGKPARKIESMSVTKFVVGLGVGKLLTDGLLKDLDTPVCEFYPEWKQGKKRLITVRHLLAHTSGLQNVTKATDEIYPSADFVQLALCAELTSEPGTEWSYNNKAANLLAGIFRRAAGMPMDEYIAANLFKPLGITDYAWTRDKAGNPHVMAGLEILPADLAKLGQLALDGGRSGAQQIVMEKWFDMALKPGLRERRRYGLLTQLFYADPGVFSGESVPPNKSDTLQCFGHTGDLGQYLLVFPKSRIVLVRMIGESPGYNPKTDSFLSKEVDDLLGQLAEVKPRQFSADDYQADATYLTGFMDSNYPYLEDNRRLGVDTTADGRNLVTKAAGAANDTEFWRDVREYLAPVTAQDPHTMVFPPNKYLLLAEEMKASLAEAGGSGPWADIVKPLVADETAKANRYWADILPAAEMPDWDIKESEDGGPWYETRRVDDRIALLRLNHFPPPSGKGYLADLDTIRAFAAGITNCPFLFIDLRGNRGGYNSWHDVVALLTPRELMSERLLLFRGGPESNPAIRFQQLKPLAKDSFPGAEKFGTTFTYWRRSRESHAPAKDGVRYAGVVCLLTDERTFSAADGMADFAKASGWAVVAGRKTGGGGLSFMPLWGVFPHTRIIFRYHTGLALSPEGAVLRGTVPDFECRDGDILEFACKNLDTIRGMSTAGSR